MTGIWCSVRCRDCNELHLFPFEAQCSACGLKTRGVDTIAYVMQRGPSAPGAGVCYDCWNMALAEGIL